VLGEHHAARINTLVTDLVRASVEAGDIQQGPRVARAMDELRDFLFERVYVGSVAKREEDKAVGMIRRLFEYYLRHPEEMPEEFKRGEDTLEKRVIDYVAGMTDRYALRRYQELFLPDIWRAD